MTPPNTNNGRESTSTSRSLIAHLQAEDPAAWDRLVLLYGPLVFGWCRRMELPEQDTADVVQDVFQAVALHLASFHRDRPADTFRGWLRTITKNKVRDHYRKSRHEPQAAGGSEARAWWSAVPDPVNRAKEFDEMDPEAQGLFRRALQLIQREFGERTWQAFWRIAVEQRPPQDVAKELGMSPGAVRVAKCRVLHRLRQELGDVSS
jgi:RNA polymerase sigma-70 factor (ECF subfamily)